MKFDFQNLGQSLLQSARRHWKRYKVDFIRYAPLMAPESAAAAAHARHRRRLRHHTKKPSAG